jgi:hypothetical protein
MFDVQRPANPAAVAVPRSGDHPAYAPRTAPSVDDRRGTVRAPMTAAVLYGILTIGAARAGH